MLKVSPHLWIVAPYTQDQEEVWKPLVQNAATCYSMDCHYNIGGPYTGTRALLQIIVPNIHEKYPDLVEAHAIEILSIAPDLQTIVPPPLGNLTSLASPEERTRFYARTRTHRLAHGIIELLIAYVHLTQIECLSLFFRHVDAADPLDQEFLAELLRRTRSQPFCIAVGTASEQPPETLLVALKNYTSKISLTPLSMEERLSFLQDRNVPHRWQEWLLRSTEGWQGEWEYLIQCPALLTTPVPQNQTFEQGLRTTLLQCPQTTREDLAQAYVESDCTSENPLERIAYQFVDSSVRQQMHDGRANTLEKVNQCWGSLGAIPYHYERGKDPAGIGAKVLAKALDYCFMMGYYEATLDCCMRGRKVVNKETQLEEYWTFTSKMTTALAVLERLEEMEQCCKETRAFTSMASVQMQLAYATAMLHTRYHREEQRDHMLAKEWIQISIALARNLQGISKEEKAFMMVFHMNGLALIELNLQHPEEALRLVTEGIEHLDRELGPDAYQLHRSVLLHNRAQVYAKQKQYDQALETFTEVIRRDPNYSEYYIDRGNVYQQLAHYEEALADYSRAIMYSPPYPEAYYNRATSLTLLGREDEALAAYTYSLELDPSSDLALINRVGILYAQGRYDEARQDITEGFIMHPGNPQLLCTLGLVEMAEEHPEEAYQALTAALQGDPTLHEAWSNRAVLEFERGNIDAAIDDLSHALELGTDATVLYNRGFAFQAQKRWKEAIADYTQALDLEGADAQELLYQRALCYLQEQQLDLAQQDFEAHLKMGDSSYLDEICRLVPSLASLSVASSS